MIRPLLFPTLLAFGMAAASPSSAQIMSDDERQNVEDALIGMMSEFEEPPLEEYAKDNIAVLRTLSTGRGGARYPDPLVIFRRAEGEEPRVIVKYLDAARLGRRLHSVEAVISSETWERVNHRARYMDYALTPPDVDWGIVVWGDGTAVLGEWIDKKHRIRRRAERSTELYSSDARGLTVDFSQMLYEEALAAIPACSSLDAGHSAARLLSDCTLLEGDRSAAASLTNQFRERSFSRVGWKRSRGPSEFAFSEGAIATVGGEKVAEGRSAVRAVWIEALPKGNLYFHRIIGHSQHHATLIGWLEILSDKQEYDRVPMTVEWIKKSGDARFDIMRVEVGELPPPAE